jgi:hypothetical protein
LGWRRTTNGGNINWNNAIDGALLVSIGTFTSGWRLPNINEIFSLVYFDNNTANAFDYAPFNYNIGHLFWSSTSAYNTANALQIRNATKDSVNNNKTLTTGCRYFPCRTFTVTGTTLT